MTVDIEAELAEADLGEKQVLVVRARWDTVEIEPEVAVAVTTWAPLAWREDGFPKPHHELSDDGVRVHVSLASLLDEAPASPEATLDAFAGTAYATWTLHREAGATDDRARLLELLTQILDGAPDADRTTPDRWEMLEPWRPMTATDVHAVVTAALGPSGHDPGPRTLGDVDEPDPDCAACAGAAFEIPFEIDEARAGFCSPHRAEALAQMVRVGSQVRQGEGDGLDDEQFEARFAYEHAMGDRFGRPHLPAHLHARYLRAGDDRSASARSLVFIDEWAGTDSQRWEAAWHDLGYVWEDDFAPTIDEIEDTLSWIVIGPSYAGDFDLALAALDAAERARPQADWRPLRGDVAAVAAREGHTELADEQIRLARSGIGQPPWFWLSAGTVDQFAGRHDAAREKFERVRRETRRDRDHALELGAVDHLIELEEDLGDDDAVRRLRRARDKLSDQLRTQRPVAARSTEPKIGRNETCWCGSGQKFKRCHGA